MSLPADLAALLDDLRPAAVRAVALERRRRRLHVAARPARRPFAVPAARRRRRRGRAAGRRLRPRPRRDGHAPRHARHGSTEDVELGLDGFWVYEPTAQDAARRGPLAVEALGASGAVLHRWSFDPLRALAVRGSPIARVAGRAEIPGARSVQLAVGSLLRTIPLGEDGSFSWSPPAGARLFSLDVAALDADGVHLAAGRIFEQDTIEQLVAQAKGEAATTTTTAPSPGLPPALTLRRRRSTARRSQTASRRGTRRQRTRSGRRSRGRGAPPPGSTPSRSSNPPAGAACSATRPRPGW